MMVRAQMRSIMIEYGTDHNVVDRINHDIDDENWIDHEGIWFGPPVMSGEHIDWIDHEDKDRTNHDNKGYR